MEGLRRGSRSSHCSNGLSNSTPGSSATTSNWCCDGSGRIAGLGGLASFFGARLLACLLAFVSLGLSLLGDIDLGVFDLHVLGARVFERFTGELPIGVLRIRVDLVMRWRRRREQARIQQHFALVGRVERLDGNFGRNSVRIELRLELR